MTSDPAADVGRWFATAVGPVDTATPSAGAPGTAASRRGLPRMPAWGRVEGGDYGRVSPPEVVSEALALLRGRRVAVLTGAGMSTGSGLPDYRGAEAVPRAPMTVQEFLGSDLARRRYWARSTVGWTRFASARPNAAHELLALLDGTAFDVTAVITQNVDALHQRGGSRRVIDLHGRLDAVRCTDCGARISRTTLHERLLELNPQVASRLEELVADAAHAPDGDAEVDRTADFRYPPCALCGGVLKPDVVFFGESADREVVAQAYSAVERAEALLVLGSSLTVQSGLRFVRAAQRAGAPVVIVNDGPTRADDRADARVHGRLAPVLRSWRDEIQLTRHPGA